MMVTHKFTVQCIIFDRLTVKYFLFYIFMVLFNKFYSKTAPKILLPEIY